MESEHTSGFFYDHQIQGIKWMRKQEKGMLMTTEKERMRKQEKAMISGKDDSKNRHSIEAVEQKRGGILADEQGLGKTLQMIGTIFTSWKKDERCSSNLVVLPKSLLEQWKVEISKFGLRSYILHGSKRDFDEIWAEHKKNQLNERQPFILLTTYGTLVTKRVSSSSDFGEKYCLLFDLTWTRVIADEAHVLKNLKSEKTTAFMSLRREITWLLTGTPIQNSSTELLSLFYIISDDASVFEFFANEDAELERIRCLRDKWMFRRTVDELKFQLPPLIRKVIDISLSSDETFAYNEERKHSVNALGLDLKVISKQRRICQHRWLGSDMDSKQLITSCFDGN